MNCEAVGAHGLSVTYGDVTVLRDVTFSIGRGELVGVVGPNGAGKSSMFRAISGGVAHGGSVRLGGEPCHHLRGRAAAGFIPQRTDIDLEFPITLGELVMTGRRRFRAPWGRTSAADREAVALAVERTGLVGREHEPIGNLSGGQLQRGLLARSLAQGADLMLLDEALSGVDAPSTERLFDLFRRLADDGATILVATHDLALARRRFDRCLAINRTLIADGAAAEVLDGALLEATFGSGGVPDR